MITVVSLLRARVGPRVFRAVHWLTYALWPVALLHGLGTGTDAGSLWMDAVAVRLLRRRRGGGHLAAAPVVRRTRAGADRAGGGPMTEMLLPHATGTARLLGPPARDPAAPPRRTRSWSPSSRRRASPAAAGPASPRLASWPRWPAVRPVVVGNAMEGEPLSAKDAVLLSRSPGPGRRRAVAARRRPSARTGCVLALGPRVPAEPVRHAARDTRVEVRSLHRRVRRGPGVRAGQPARRPRRRTLRPARARLPPRHRRPPHARAERGDARPARPAGAPRRRLVPLPRHPVRPGHLPGHRSAPPTPRRLTHPGVLEVPRGTPLRSVLRVRRAPTSTGSPAVLVGGYHGAWVPATADVLLTVDDLARFGASPGCGRGARPRPGRPARSGHAATVARYLAGQSARQCGPCVNGLPRMAAAPCSGWPSPGAAPGLVAEVRPPAARWSTDAARARTPTGPPGSSPARCASSPTTCEQHLGGACDAGAR